MRPFAKALFAASAICSFLIGGSAASAAVCPNEEIRVAQRATALPECRAYEMVTPLEKGGVDVTGLTQSNFTKVTDDGDAVAFSSVGAFAGALGGAFPNVYRASRTVSGWKTAVVSTPQRAGLFASTGTVAGVTSRVDAMSDDLGKALVRTNMPLDPNAPKGVFNLYTREVGTNDYELLTPGGPEGNSSTPLPWYAWATPELDRVVFTSTLPLTPEAPAEGPKVYVGGAGGIELASKLPGPAGGAPSTGIPGALSDQTIYASEGAKGAISEDGRRVFFTLPGSSWGGPCAAGSGEGCGLYVRDLLTDTTSEVVDESEMVRFVAAALDGSRVMYTLNSQFHVYDVESDTYETAGGDLLGGPALAVTDDLSVAYIAVSGDLEIWRWEVGSAPELLADLEGGSSSYASTFNPGGVNWMMPVRYDVSMTPDGGQLVFASDASVDGGEAHDGIGQVYRYDADNDETVCISCPSGPATGSAYLSGMFSWAGSPNQQALAQPRAISEDGSKVFFETDEPLVAADSDGKSDVYMWNEGQRTLLTPGISDQDFRMINSTPDGESVFVVTREPLVGSDTDRIADIYALRVDGGFAEPPPPDPGCNGGPCADSRVSPSPIQPSSAHLRGPGNRRAQRNCAALRRKAKRATNKAQKAKLKKRASKCRRGSK